MKAGDVVAIQKNIWVQLVTSSKWSHVAMLTDENHMIEANLNGVKKCSLDECVKGAKKCVVFHRPIEFSVEQKVAFDVIIDASNGRKYSLSRAGLAALRRIMLNFYMIFGTCFALYFYFFDNCWTLQDCLIWFLTIFFAMFLTNIAGKNPLMNKFVERCGLWEKLKTDLYKTFCSQLVLEIDRGVGGQLSMKLHSELDQLPKDIVRCCNELGWKKTDLSNRLK